MGTAISHQAQRQAAAAHQKSGQERSACQPHDVQFSPQPAAASPPWEVREQPAFRLPYRQVWAIDKDVAEHILRSANSSAVLMRGDIDGYPALVTYTDDFTLMSPFGGKPARAADVTQERWDAMGRFFRNCTFEQELVQSYGSADMVALATIERIRIEVGGLPAQDWRLRVTLVYCREGAEWRLAHRHADPLVAGVSLEQAAPARREAT